MIFKKLFFLRQENTQKGSKYNSFCLGFLLGWAWQNHSLQGPNRLLFQPIESVGLTLQARQLPLSQLSSPRQWLFSEAGLGPSVSTTYAGKMVSGKQDAVNFSGSAHLISSFPPHGFLRVIFLKKHSPRKNSALTCSSGEAQCLVYLPQQHWEKSSSSLSGFHIVDLFDIDILNEDIHWFFFFW